MIDATGARGAAGAIGPLGMFAAVLAGELLCAVLGVLLRAVWRGFVEDAKANAIAHAKANAEGRVMDGIGGMNGPTPGDRANERTNAARCPRSPSGEHDEYVVTCVRAAAGGIAFRASCARCGEPRLGDFAIETTLVGGDGHVTETTFSNLTERAIGVTIGGTRYTMQPQERGGPLGAGKRSARHVMRPPDWTTD